MIVEFLFNIVKAVLTFILDLFPSWTPVDLSGYASEFVSWIPSQVSDALRWANYYVPLREAVLLSITAVVMWAGVVVYKVVRDILVILHISGG